MPEARERLQLLHARAFGDPWLLLGISVAGLWGIWNGLVRQRAIETMTGLAATVGLMVCGLVVIAKPAETVGWAAAATNDAATSVMAAANGTDSSDALAGSLRGVFDSTVRDPWCALQFGQVQHCSRKTGDAKRPTVADVWLTYPAQSWERDRLFRQTKDGKQQEDKNLLQTAGGVLGFGDDRKLGDDTAKLIDKQPDRVALQQEGGTFPRLALLSMVCVGLLGACAVFAYLGVRLLLASAMTLLLLLIAPAMLIAPAFGQAGRLTFLAWAKRLLGAIAAKLVYAIFLTVVLVAARVFASLEVGWLGTWLVLTSFWWGVFLKRAEIVGFVAASVPHKEGGTVGQAMSQGYYAFMLGRTAKQALDGAAAPSMAIGQRLRADGQDRRQARQTATAALATDRLDQHGRQQLETGQTQAREVTTTAGQARTELAAVDRRLRVHDEAVASANARRGEPPPASPETQDLLAHRTRLRELVDDPHARTAEQTVRHADRNRALTGEPVSRNDLDVHHNTRARQLRDQPPTREDKTERELRAAREPQPTRRDVRKAQGHLDSDELRKRTAEEHAKRRAERRRQRLERKAR